MLHILVADDMPLQVRMLQESIRQMRPQDEVVTAQNGEEVLRILRQRPVDLVLSDIRMPCMDGLELLGHIRRMAPRTKVIFITGYALFEYAQQALRQGAVDFLVKPVEAAELGRKLDEWDERFAREREENSEIERQRLQLTLQRFLCTPRDQLTDEDAAALRGLGEGWIAAVQMPEPREAERIARAATAMLSCGVELTGHPYAVTPSAERHMLFLVVQGREAEQAALLTVLGRAAQENGLRIGLSEHRADLLLEGFEACRAARQGVDDAFYAGEPACLCKAARGPCAPDLIRPDELHRLLLCEKPERTRTLEGLFARVAAARPDVTHLLEGSVYNIIRCGEMLGPSAAPVTAAFAAHMRQARCFADYRTLVSGCMEDLAAGASDALERSGDPISRCILYLQRNYAEQISVEDMARRFYLTPNYFSALFKKRTNQRFVEYLTNLRLEKAAEQLRTTDDYVYAITQRCGYLDERYFIRQFQKHYHMSPVAYRRLHRGGGKP